MHIATERWLLELITLYSMRTIGIFALRLPMGTFVYNNKDIKDYLLVEQEHPQIK